MATDEQRLLVRLEATATKLVNEMNKARKVTQAELAKIDAAVANSNKRVTQSIAKNAAAYRSAGTGLRDMRGQVQNTAFQVQDFAVQVASGTSATQALAQQLPQLLGGLGLFGAVAGAAAAVAIPLGAAFLGASNDAETLSDSLDALEKAVRRVDSANRDAGQSINDLRAKYGANADAAREILEIQRELAELNAGRAFGAAARSAAGAISGGLAGFDPATLSRNAAALTAAKAEAAALVAEFRRLEDGSVSFSEAEQFALQQRAIASRLALTELSRYRDELENIASTFGITEDAAAQLAIQIAQVNAAATSQERLAAARDLATAIFETTDGLKEADEEAVALYDSLLEAVRAGLDLEALNIAGTIGAAADQAARLERLLSRIGQKEPVIFDPRDPRYNRTRATMERLREEAGDTSPFALDSSVGTGGTGRTSSGARSGAAEDPRDFMRQRLDASQMALEAARAEAAAVIFGAEAAQEATIRYELLAEAKRRNLDLDQRSVETGLTLRQEIDQQAAAIARLTIEADSYRQRAQFMADIQTDLQDGFVKAIVAGESFAGVLANVARKIAEAALQAALFGRGPLATLFGGSPGTGLLTGLGGFGGFRAAGGPVQSGKAYVVGENGPEIFRPGSSGMIIPNTRIGDASAKAPIVNVAPSQPIVHVAVVDDQDRIGEYLASSTRAEAAVMRIVKRNGG